MNNSARPALVALYLQANLFNAIKILTLIYEMKKWNFGIIFSAILFIMILSVRGELNLL